MTFAIITEIVAIFMALAMAVAKSEVGDNNVGLEKKKEAIATIEKELTDKGGIQVTNKYVVAALPKVLPFLVDGVVFLANKTGFFGKSSK